MALGPALVQDLQSRGFIIIASVATPEAVSELEKKGKGYVKALVLNPHDVSYVFLFCYIREVHFGLAALLDHSLPEIPTIHPFSQIPHYTWRSLQYCTSLSTTVTRFLDLALIPRTYSRTYITNPIQLSSRIFPESHWL